MHFRRVWWVGVIGVLAIGSAGFFSWSVKGLVRNFVRPLEAKTGWQMGVNEARWIPWLYLELKDLQLTTAQGGHLHLVKVRITPQWRSLCRGVLATQWEIGEIRMDPASFRIRRPWAQELLSAGPVTSEGLAFLEVAPKALVLKNLVLRGVLLRLHAQGVFHPDSTGQLDVQGELAEQILEGMNLAPTDRAQAHPWEPFRIHLEGKLRSPQFSFASNFLSISQQAHQE